jgi:hypothetical protein
VKPKPVRVVGPGFSKERDKLKGTVVMTTSKAGWSSQLSPFLLGPCPLYDGLASQTMENGWQFSKVYVWQVDKHGNPTMEWWRWAMAGWDDNKAHRYPMGRGRKPLYSMWKGEHLDYVPARKRIYVRLYAKAVVKTAAFRKLQKMYKAGEQLILWDYDGYDHIRQEKSLRQVLNDPKKIMGHAFVLAMLLQEEPMVTKYLP